MSKMLHEAKEASSCMRRQLSADASTYSELGRRLRELNPAMVGTIARGSSDHAATYASYLIPFCTGRPVSSLAPSLVTVLKAPLNLNRQFVLSISQSGRSPDIIAALGAVKTSGAMTAAIINDVDSPLAKMVDVLLPQHAGAEGIAATKTVLCTLTAVARMVGEWTQDAKLLARLQALPEVMDSAFLGGMQLDASLLRGISSAYVLSRGLGLSSALEIALKLKETCGIHAEAFSTAEVRHGPREIVDDEFMVIALALPGSGRDDVLAAAGELKAQGARVMLIDLETIPGAEDPRLSPLIVLQLMYPWLASSSLNLGYDPDRPKTLKSKVIHTV
jgi:fructoselysine-6-P-deglycase FrlB-like protein